ncbi:hypothetical protein ACHAXT_011760 [Thalassiosira profunda]
MATDSGASAAESALWNEVCLASAYFDRAQTLHNNCNSGAPTSTDEKLAIASAERALELYQSCLRRAKRQWRSSSAAARQLAALDSSSKSQPRDPKSCRDAWTVNLELRMAQALRFLASVRAASPHYVKSDAGSGNPDEAEKGQTHLKQAIEYHDKAVSLLVGVFDAEENGESDDVARQQSDSINNSTNSEESRSESRDPPQQVSREHRRDPQGSGDVAISESFSEEGQTGRGGRVLLTISFPDDETLSKQMKSGAPHATQAQFISPTEDERVRAIAASLNALADLHAQSGDDRAAMDSYREALEILRAAADEEEEEEEDTVNEDSAGQLSRESSSQGNRDAPGMSAQQLRHQSSSTVTAAISPIQIDLFHLRRDELDAALNAYSTVWALHSGNSLEGQDGETNSHVPTPSTPSNSVEVGSHWGASLPHLTTPRTPATPTAKSLGTPASQSSFATPAADSNNRPMPTTPGALEALINLGIVHERRSELSEALSCFQYVHSVRSEQLGREHPDTANCLINIGNCHQRLFEWDKAGAAYEEAVGGYRTLLRRRTMMMGIEDEAGNFESSGAALQLHRSLAGALRNQGTCYWKQRRISDAIDCLNEAVDAEAKIVTLFTSSEGITAGYQSAVRQAKESMAQLLGLMGCLYLEYRIEELKSHDKAVEAFQRALQLYHELNYDPNHPSVLWARQNMSAVEQLRQSGAPPPPPPSTTQVPSPVNPDAPPTNPVAPTAEADEVVDLDDIDSVSLDEALASDGEGTDDEDIFLDLEATSTDELDQQGRQRKRMNEATDERPSLEDEAARSELEPAEEDPNAGLANKPLSYEHRNISSSLLSDQGEPDTQQDDQESELVSQLQLISQGSDEGDVLEAAEAHVALGQLFFDKGDRESATSHYTEAHAIYSSELGDSAQVAHCLKRLGDLNAEDEALDAAKELYLTAMDMELAVNGEYDPQTLNAAGTACLKNDEFRDAMDFHRRALQLQKKEQSGDKYEIYETLVRIGDVYYQERNNLSNIRSNGGVDYQEFIESGFLGWIANAHDMRGEYTRAIQFYEESLQIYQSRRGKEARRETALTLNRLGALCREMGRFDEALDYHQKALNIQKSGSGAAKASSAETCVLMGMVNAAMGKFLSALDLYEDSLLVLKNALGTDHSSYWKTLSQIGSIHFAMSNYDEATGVLLEAERRQLASVGGGNRDTLETQALIGRVLTAMGKYDEALEKLQIVCERQTKLFGPKHPTIADTLSYIGECLLDQGLNTEARAQFVACYTMRKQFFSVDQLLIAQSMVDIIRVRSGQPERALAIYRNASEVYKEYLSDDHYLIGRLCMYEADSHAEMLNFATAIDRYEQARQIFRKAFGENNAIDSALVAVSIGKVLLRKCDYDAAKSSFTSALKIYLELLPEGHPKITSTLNHLDRVEQEEELCV